MTIKRYDMFSSVIDREEPNGNWMRVSEHYEVVNGLLDDINSLRGNILGLAQDHYWDTFEKDKDLIVKHIEGFLNQYTKPEWKSEAILKREA